MAEKTKREDGLVTPREAADFLRIPLGTLAVWRSTGRVKLAYIKIGHAVRYDRADLERLVLENRRES